MYEVEMSFDRSEIRYNWSVVFFDFMLYFQSQLRTFVFIASFGWFYGRVSYGNLMDRN